MRFSGGHINPAVTLALTICRGLEVVLAPLYIISQLIGAVIGAALARVRFHFYGGNVCCTSVTFALPF